MISQNIRPRRARPPRFWAGLGRKKIKVLVALSGGVDSAVAATLLIKEGYAVTAAYMVNYDPVSAKATAGKARFEVASQAIAPSSGATACWLPDYRDAVRVAAHLNIPIIKLDFTKEYKAKVLDYMFKEYELGRTPNPDVLCNKYIKFGVWLEHARELGFDFLATGHYARREPGISNIKYRISNKNLKSQLLPTTYSLLTSVDTNKDQTYFLHQLNQGQLQHVLFPIGVYIKPQVRALAKKFKLPVANKAESMGICFIGEVPMKEFLETRIKPKPGNIVLSDGTIVGRHDGLAFYTIGQRHMGESIKYQVFSIKHDTRPLYVVAKRVKTNELVVGYEDDPLLYTKEILVNDVNWTSGQASKFPLKCEVRLRHRQPLQKCIVIKTREQENKRTVMAHFEKSQRSVTPGQFAVFYLKGECLGGGVIE